MNKPLNRNLIQKLGQNQVMNFYGEKFSPMDFASFSIAEDITPPAGYIYYKDIFSKTRMIDAFGNCSTVFAEKKETTAKFECLSKLLELAFLPFPDVSNIEKFIKKIEYKHFIDKAFFSAVIDIYAQYQKELIEYSRKMNKKINHNKLEKSMKEIFQICEKKLEKAVSEEKHYKDALNSIEPNC